MEYSMSLWVYSRIGVLHWLISYHNYITDVAVDDVKNGLNAMLKYDDEYENASHFMITCVVVMPLFFQNMQNSHKFISHYIIPLCNLCKRQQQLWKYMQNRLNRKEDLYMAGVRCQNLIPGITWLWSALDQIPTPGPLIGFHRSRVGLDHSI